MRVAAIDVGSNSVLLTVMDDGVEIEATSVVTALGEGTKESGVLSDAAMDRTLQAIADAWSLAEAKGAEFVRAGGTMALRIARNSDEFQRRARAQGTPVDVVSGEMEAELSFRSVAEDPTFAGAERLSIVDTGGHSTELVTADRTESGWQVVFRRSYPIGALGLKGGVLADQTPDFAARLAALNEIDDAIGLEYLPGQCGTVVALGATPTNLVTILERMPEWDPTQVHGATLDFEEISKAVGALSDLNDAGRAALVGIEPGRERTIHIGALILERFLQALHALECRVTVRGWRHAYV